MGRSALVLALVGLAWLVTPAYGRGPARVLHERFDPDPLEELSLHATTDNGRLPGAIHTRAGPVSAPGEAHEVREAIYGRGNGTAASEKRFELDARTMPPDSIRYHDPFRPGTAPFKRVFAFDRVEEDFSLGVRSPELVGVPTASVVTAKDDAFYADFFVDLEAGVPTRIVSVAPGARIVAMYSEPDRLLEVLEDGAENWFVRGKTTERLRVVMQVAAPRRAFAFRARLGNYRTIESRDPPPQFLVEAARPVLAQIGVDRTLSPSVVLERLVAYFRGFHASPELPRASDAVGLYRELSLSRRGVCRHRAFAFAVSAQALGFRVRVVHNEAHAWVEVFDGEGFARIDLGGAPPRLSPIGLDPEVPLYEPEQEPFAWPLGQASGQEMGRRMRAPVSEATPLSWPGSVESTALPSGQGPRGTRQSSGVLIDLRVQASAARRGGLVDVQGHAGEPGQVCVHQRVDIFLEHGDTSREVLGSVLTDSRGDFRGQVTLPRDAPLGRAALVAELAGTCEPKR